MSPALPGAPRVVLGAHSYSEGWQEYPPRVWYSPEIDASMFALHILWDTPGGSQRLNYILLMWIGSPLYHSARYNPPSFRSEQFQSALLHPPLSALLNFIPHSLTPPLSTLLSLNLTVWCFIPRFSNTFRGTPLFLTILPIWHSSFPLVVVPIVHPNVSCCLS